MDELIDSLKPIYETKTDERIISHQIATSDHTYVLDKQYCELTPRTHTSESSVDAGGLVASSNAEPPL